MLPVIALALPIIMGFPAVSVKWLSDQHQALTVEVAQVEVPGRTLSGVEFADLSAAESEDAQAAPAQDREAAEFIGQCLRSGFELRYRFTVQLCRRRQWWVDTCDQDRQIFHSLRFDPVSGNFRLARDRLGDADAPLVVSYDSLDPSLREISKISVLQLADLIDRGSKWAPLQNFEKLRQQRPYVKVRTAVDCKGEHNQTLSQLSYVLTLGLVRISGFASGVIAFNLFER